MFGIEWSELAVIAVVALIVIGPKDLPRALRTLGIWVRKARAVSREFQSSVEQMVREAELEEVRREIEQASKTNLQHELEKTIDPKGELAEALKPPAMPSLTEPPKAAAPPAGSPAAAEPNILPPPSPAPTPLVAAPVEAPAGAAAPHHPADADTASAGSAPATKTAAGS
jgi:sec-independent protein translocase protein TatB